MKIVFTGGGTGGHFYPIIAVAERVNKIIDQEKIVGAKLYFVSSSPYDKEALFQNGLIYEEVTAGKLRTYFSFKNFSDVFKMIFGVLRALVKIFLIYPDVVFGKGGYASFPTLCAARLLGIPVVVHESDSAPGRVNLWAGKFAKRIALSFEDASVYFNANKVAWTGQPLRLEIEHPNPREKALEYFKLESSIPVLFIIGGSQGAELINNTIIDALPRLVQSYQVIHQTGINNFKSVKGQADVVLEGNENKSRYIPLAYLNALQMQNASGAATLVISRAGSQIFEIASWGVPSILVPITNSNLDHQKKNAFSYARAGCCSVIEEMNMTANILCSEVERILGDKRHYDHMASSARLFHKPDAAAKIARELVNIALGHEK
jgi:UDP-N-acetylglucosamine--N-acetylmuramyl-(pentapeptide) pyrophosphoryl-undecaprenol N-acetylglucosamine transferase